jgi:hypothetical protein
MVLKRFSRQKELLWEDERKSRPKVLVIQFQQAIVVDLKRQCAGKGRSSVMQM